MNTILETLDVLLGFVGIMLVLSLFVTALVQFIQSAFALRAKNLGVGLCALLEKVFRDGGADKPAADPQPKGGTQGNAPPPTDAIVRQVMERASFVPESNASWFTKVLSPTVTWVNKEELIEYLNKVRGELSEQEKAKLTLLFPRMEVYSCKRFALNLRLITILCSVVVACAFQVSTPALLKRLSSDPRYRAEAASLSAGLAGEAPALIAASTNYQDVSEMALEQLTGKFPDRAEYLERASGLAQSRGDLVAELQTVLNPVPASERGRIVEEYEKLLGALHEKGSTSSIEQMENLAGKLAKFDLSLWPKGAWFFASAENIIGVIITAAFLTFGAPFWFGRLRELIQLRDALKPKEENRKN